MANDSRASYVDSKLAELHGGAESSKLAQSRAVGNLPKHIHSSMYGHGPKPATESEALQEVDLGPEAVLQNIARTEAARRKLAVGESLDSDSEAPKRVRLGRDGKPRRNRNRRSSADMKRDQMVERLMRDTQRKQAYDVHSIYPCLVYLIQWAFSKSKKLRKSPAMARRQMIESQSSSGKNTWNR